MKLILGIDPGLNITGFGIINYQNLQFQYIASGYIKTSYKNTESEKLFIIYTNIYHIIEKYHPKQCAIEEIFVSKKNFNSSLKLGKTSGVIQAAISAHKLSIFTYSPKKIKKLVTGYGSASKKQIKKMVSKILDIYKVEKQDTSDALAIAICHALSQSNYK